jgi:hypothetical protein
VVTLRRSGRHTGQNVPAGWANYTQPMRTPAERGHRRALRAA